MFPVLLSDQPDLSRTSDHNTTSDISPVLFDLLSSQLNRDPLWPFHQTSSCYLLSQSPRKVVVFLSLCLWSVRACSRVVCESCSSNILKGSKEPMLFLYNPLLPCSSLLFSQTHYLTLRLVSREKIKTMCPSFCLSCSQKGGAQISWSEIWKVLQTNAICRGCPNGV